jgi:hypothetical protein
VAHTENESYVAGCKPNQLNFQQPYRKDDIQRTGVLGGERRASVHPRSSGSAVPVPVRTQRQEPGICCSLINTPTGPEQLLPSLSLSLSLSRARARALSLPLYLARERTRFLADCFGFFAVQ